MSRRNATPDEQARWAAEREARTSALLDQLQTGVAAVQSSDQFRRYLRCAARFHSYSVNNVILILCQDPEATRVAGYHNWQRLGRQVKKGAKAIYIFAPRPYQVTTANADGDEETRDGCAFKAVPVFDIAQTDGDPLPTLAASTLIGDAGAATYAVLCAIAAAEGLRVTTQDPDGDDTHPRYQGYYSAGRAMIYVKLQEPTHMCKTLIHELAHHFDHTLNTTNRAERETVAESVAFLVAAHQGIDSGSYSFPYLASWAGQDDGTEVIRRVLGRVQAVAHRLLTALEESTFTAAEDARVDALAA